MLQIFINICRFLFAVIIIHWVDIFYFQYLHKGLKFPDYFPIMFFTIFIVWKFLLKKNLYDLMGVNINDIHFIKKQFIYGFLYGSLIVFLSIVIGLFTFQIVFDINMKFLKNMMYFIFGYLLFIPISALYEELHYRGVYIRCFRTKYIQYFLWIISSIIFSFVHLSFLENYPIYYHINIFLIGVILSLLSIRKNNLMVSVGFHVAWNFILIFFSPFFNENSEKYVEFNSVTTFILILVVIYEIIKINNKTVEWTNLDLL